MPGWKSVYDIRIEEPYGSIMKERRSDGGESPVGKWFRPWSRRR